MEKIDITRAFLPLPLTSFIGREEKLEETAQLLSQTQTRLLTLVGPGGAGKTRFALHLALNLNSSFTDEVCFVELAPLQDADFIVPLLAKKLQVNEDPGQELLTTLTAYLAGKRLLLILDNCEHLVESCAVVVEQLLRSCPLLKILATSREGLGVNGELLVQINPLLLPPNKGEWTASGGGRVLAVGELLKYEAIQLFVVRARAVQSDFKVTASNGWLIVEICRHLDGIPLAIELTVPWLRMLSLAQIFERLRAPFGLLTSGTRTAMPHHRSLEVLVNWSYNLLTPKEQLLLNRMSVFRGSWTLEAANAVGVGDYVTEDVAEGKQTNSLTIKPSEMLSLLKQLVDKSLVQVGTELNSTELKDDYSIRYYLLETIQAFAWQKLEERQETASVLERHLDWYLKLAEEAELHLQATGQAKWLGQLEHDYTNIRAALGRGLDPDSPDMTMTRLKTNNPAFSEVAVTSIVTTAANGVTLDHTGSGSGSGAQTVAVEKALQMVAALWRFWEIRAHYHEGTYWLDKALVQADRMPVAPQLKARLLYGAGMLASLDNFSRSLELQTENLRLRRELGDWRGIAEALGALGWLEFNQGIFDKARKLAIESLDLSRKLGNTPLIASALFLLGLLSFMTGDYAQTYIIARESLPMWQALGDQNRIANTLTLLGATAFYQGRTGEAKTFLLESLRLHIQLANRHGIFSAILAVIKLVSELPELTRDQHLVAKVIRLLGAAGPGSDGSPGFLPIFQPIFDSLLVTFSNLSDPFLFAQLYADGRNLTIEEVNLVGQAILELVVEIPISTFASTTTSAGPSTPAAVTSKNPLIAPAGPINFHELTEREIEVLKLVAAGLTNNQVAEKLIISRRTVEAHLRAIYEKLDLSSRSAAIHFALTKELI